MSASVQKAMQILHRFHESGHEAYLVGGFVRDFLLGLETEDIDVTTSALPEETIALFDKTAPTGIRFGTVTVFLEDEAFEVTTFRSEGSYKNHRHPDSVTFSKSLPEDLSRRDFTINAFAMDDHQNLFDLFGGQSDLHARLIRAIGEPEKRFEEDALRILRAFRFVAKLGFDIEEKTMEAIQQKHPLLSDIANERVLEEMRKIINYPHRGKAFSLMAQSGVLDTLTDLKAGIIRLEGLELPLTETEFYAFCFSYVEDNPTELWRFSNKTKQRIHKLIELLEVLEHDEISIYHIYSLGKEICLSANKLLVLKYGKADRSDEIVALYDTMPIHKTCDLKYKGGEIMNDFPIKNAEIIGDIIDDVIYQVITNQLENEEEDIYLYVKQTYFNE